jgi:hypothetical protein
MLSFLLLFPLAMTVLFGFFCSLGKKMVFSLFLVCGFDIKKLAIKGKEKEYLRLFKKYLNCLSGPTNASQDCP